MADHRTLGDLDREGGMTADLVSHLERVHGAGWRDVTVRDDADERAGRIAGLDQGIAADVEAIAEDEARIAELDARVRALGD